MRSHRPYAACADGAAGSRGTRSGRYALPALLALLALGGCASIHSESVRGLIDRQAEKTKQAAEASKTFVNDTQARVEAYQKGVGDLNKSLQTLRTQESVFALALASSQPVESKTGIDARAFGYQAGLLYLDTQAGLDQAVTQQFQEDFAAMQALSQQIAASWQSLQELQSQLTRYAQQSGVASADPALVAAIVGQTHVSPEKVDEVIRRSRQVNQALEKASGWSALQGEEATRARGYLQDLIELLDSAAKR